MNSSQRDSFQIDDSAVRGAIVKVLSCRSEVSEYCVTHGCEENLESTSCELQTNCCSLVAEGQGRAWPCSVGNCCRHEYVKVKMGCHAIHPGI